MEEKYSVIYTLDRSRAAYPQHIEIRADIQIHRENGCWYARASFVPSTSSSNDSINLEVILNGPGRSKATKKIQREIAAKFLEEPN